MQVLDSAQVDGPVATGLEDLAWIGAIPRQGSERCPERTAILFADRGERVSYLDLERRSNAFVALLRARGVQSGDRVAYLGRNSDLYFAVLFGAIRAGVVLVPLNWRLAAPEIRYQLADSTARLLICDPELQDLAQESIRELPVAPALLFTEPAAGTEDLRALLLRDAPTCAVPTVQDQIILQLYTSGTTGHPKGVLISHYALSFARHAERLLPGLAHLGEGAPCLSAMPNFHIGGMSWVLMGLLRQGTVVLTADPMPDNLLRLIREHGSEHTFIVPTVLRAIVDTIKASGEPAPKLKGVFYGAMPIGESLLRESLDLLGCAFVQFFGMTENTGSVTVLQPQDHDPARPQILKSVGKPYPGMSLQVRGSDRRVLAPNEHGEIWVRSPTLMSGYWNLPEKTREAIVDDWYATGDGGYIDAEGFLYLTDRIKDMIVSGGENVYPVEVEEALRQHPAVLDAAVVGVADERWGEIVTAVVELRPGASAGADEIIAAARSRIAGYKCPKAVHFGSLPRTASGKVQRALLRERLKA
jgi:acyl-CoA synthetase (AMP-forming)/AMP-acid ligase II